MTKYWNQTILDELVQLLRDGKLYLFAGAGVSQLAGYPSWKELLEQFSDKYKAIPKASVNTVPPDELLNLIERCDIGIIDHLTSLGTDGIKACNRILRNIFFQNNNYDKVHRHLLELPFAGYITTNYDRCFESAVQACNIKVSLINNSWFCYPKNDFDNSPNALQQLTQKNPFLLHMHGCIECNGRQDVSNIILSNYQYGKFYKEQEMNIISNKCSYEHLLILGTSLKDPYFMNDVKFKRTPSDPTNLANRKKWFVVRHTKEKSNTTISDEKLLEIAYDYFNDYSNGLKNMIEELADAYRSASSKVII